MGHKEILEEAEKEVAVLLGLYEQYRKKDAEKLALETEKSRDAQERVQKLGTELQEISNTIRFKTPLLWMMFKHKRGMIAPRKNDRIANFGDFKRHCSHEALTCGRRIAFLNKELKQKTDLNLFDTMQFPDSLQVESVYSRDEVIAVAADAAVAGRWQTYEFYEEQGIPHKWENYSG